MKQYAKGKFSGRYDSSTEVNFLHILKWKLFNNPSLSWRRKSITPLKVESRSEDLSLNEDFICWLSHASFLIQLGGKRILIDPVLGNLPFYKRQIPVPYYAEALGEIDYLLISHVHYDHFDRKSLSAISSQIEKAILPLHMSKVLHKTAPNLKTKELDWYESYDDGTIKITFVPARHWGRRGIFDKNRVLWGGYVLTHKGKNIYFSGDSAVGDHFVEIGNRFNIDYALLPIGDYKPEFIMKHNHLNPQEAFDAATQLKAKKMIPMHYGTFKLTDEPLDEALAWMQQIAKENPDKINILKAGEVFIT